MQSDISYTEKTQKTDAEKTALYLVPTPIGNLGDITIRALQVLQQVDIILAEDTRKSSILLRHYHIKKPMKSFHMFNEHKKVDALIDAMMKGRQMALVTDAGTPGISDPGFLIVRRCEEKKLRIESLPGPTALIPALIQSGFPTDRFVFEGYLPHKKGRHARWRKLACEERTIILYESPHRLQKTLTQMIEYFGEDRIVSISRELTKIHEETTTANLKETSKLFGNKKIKGEIVIVIRGCSS